MGSDLGDRLIDVWHDQRVYNDRVKKLQDRSSTDWLTTYLLGIVSEAGDLLDAFSWKQHRPSRRLSPQDLANIRVEVVDLFKYVMCLAQEVGMDLEELLYLVDEKGKFLDFQLDSDFQTQYPLNRPILICDLDGTIADFRTAFVDFLTVEGSIPGTPLNLMRNSPTIHMDVASRVGFDAYHALKTTFEVKGGYAELTPLQEMVQVVERLQQDITVVFFTARPTELKRVRQDTWEWLRFHGLKPKTLFFGKFERILWAATMRDKGYTVWLLDDDPEVLQRAVNSGIPVIAVKQPYNEDLIKSLGIASVDPEWDSSLIEEEMRGSIR